MSEVAPDTGINVGLVLAQSARLAMRHWLLGLIAAVSMAGMCLLLLDLAGSCFGAGHEACIGKAFLDFPRGQGKALVGDAITVAPLVAEFIVSVVMLRLFYLREDPIPEQSHIRAQELRIARFLGRAALAWILVATLPVLLDTGYLHVSWLLYPEYTGGPVRIWISYLATKAISTSLASYLRARLILFLPATIYQQHPDQLSTAWNRTHPVRWRLFFVYWLIGLAIVLIQVLFDRLAPLAIDFGPLAQGLAAWSHADLRYITSLLPAAIVYSVLVPLIGLWSAGVSIIVYRKLIVIDHLRATVFD